MKKRLKEPSTWAGLGAILTAGAQAFATGSASGGERAGWIAAAFAALSGLAAIVLPETSGK